MLQGRSLGHRLTLQHPIRERRPQQTAVAPLLAAEVLPARPTAFTVNVLHWNSRGTRERIAQGRQINLSRYSSIAWMAAGLTPFQSTDAIRLAADVDS